MEKGFTTASFLKYMLQEKCSQVFGWNKQWILLAALSFLSQAGIIKAGGGILGTWPWAGRSCAAGVWSCSWRCGEVEWSHLFWEFTFLSSWIKFYMQNFIAWAFWGMRDWNLIQSWEGEKTLQWKEIRHCFGGLMQLGEQSGRWLSGPEKQSWILFCDLSPRWMVWTTVL